MKEIKCEICDKNFKSSNALEMHNSSKHHGKSSKSGKNMIYIGVTVLLVIGIIAFFALKNSNASTTTDNLQKITLSFSGNYAPNTIYAKQGIPVEITLDNSVTGCYRGFTIPALKVSKISTSPSDKVKFTPDKAGIFRFQCQMNMGYGTLIVN